MDPFFLSRNVILEGSLKESSVQGVGTWSQAQKGHQIWRGSGQIPTFDRGGCVVNVEHKADVTWRQGCSSASFASTMLSDHLTVFGFSFIFVYSIAIFFSFFSFPFADLLTDHDAHFSSLRAFSLKLLSVLIIFLE